MAIHKKRTEEITNGLLLEAVAAVELPPAEVDESAVVLQFDSFAPFVAELLETLRGGAVAETIPVIRDGSTFQIHGATRTFWVKLWHAPDSDLSDIARVQVLNALPSMRGVRIKFDIEN